MEKTADRLRRWGISEEVVKKFEDTHITDDLLPLLDDDLLKDLIPSPIELVRFNIHRNKEFTGNKLQVIAAADAAGVVTVVQDSQTLEPELTSETVIDVIVDGEKENNEVNEKECKNSGEKEKECEEPASSTADVTLVKTNVSQAPTVKGCWNDTAEINISRPFRISGKPSWENFSVRNTERVGSH